MLWVTSLSLLLLTIPLFPPHTPVAADEPLVIGPLRATVGFPNHRWITVGDGVIESVTSVDALTGVPEEREETIGAGLYGMPGLIDSHVHLPPRLPPGQLDYLLLMLLRHGVTGVRELGSPYLDVDELEASINAGGRPGPRIFSCGQPLTGGGNGRRLQIFEVVEDFSDVEEAIETRAGAGYRCAKIYRGFPGSLLPATADLATRLGLSLVGHLPRDSSWESSEVNDIQHICDPRCINLTPAAIQGLGSAARSSGVRHTPTLVTFDNPLIYLANAPSADGPHAIPRSWRTLLWNPEVLAQFGIRGFLDVRSMKVERENVRDAVKNFIRLGATLQVGTDTPFPFVVPGLSVHEEMRLFAELGLPLDQVWESATSTPGEFLSGGPLGRIESGAPADILLFREDPTRDLRALSTLEIVIAAGRVYRVEDLKTRIAEQLKYLDGPIYKFGIEPTLRAAVRSLTEAERYGGVETTSLGPAPAQLQLGSAN